VIDTAAAPADDAFVRALPKVELHVHVEGAAPPATIAELAANNGVDLGVDDPADLYHYADLADFLRVFDLVCRSIRRADDMHRVAYEALAIAATAGVRYREMFFSPTFLMRHGMAFADIWAGLVRGIDDAHDDYGIVCRMILDVHKPAGPAAATELIELAAAADRDVLIGVGGDGGEHDVDLAGFAEPFALARRHGLHTTMHLGEEGPPSDIRIGVDELGVERIDHGFSLIDDPALLAEVAERRIGVTCCPTSNRRIGLIERVDQHPVMRLRERGVLATLHSDNAAMFDIDLAEEMCVVRDAFGLGRGDLEALCMDAVDSAWLDDTERRGMRAEFAEQMARPR
jgi:adenosine deaminase